MPQAYAEFDGDEIYDAFSMPAIAEVIRAVKERQIRRAFETSGQSNDTNWPPIRPLTIRARGRGKPLLDTGALKRSITVRVTDIEMGVATIEVGSSARAGDHNLGAIHQFGVRKPILPKRGKHLFIPLLNVQPVLGTKTVKTKRGPRGIFGTRVEKREVIRWKAPPGGKFRARRSVLVETPGGGRVRMGQRTRTRTKTVTRFKRTVTGMRAVKEKVRVPEAELVSLQRGKDFILSKGIFPTAEKDGYTIQPRPFATLTDRERTEIIDNIVRMLRRRR